MLYVFVCICMLFNMFSQHILLFLCPFTCRQAGVSPNLITIAECHGTGAPAWDHGCIVSCVSARQKSAGSFLGIVMWPDSGIVFLMVSDSTIKLKCFLEDIYIYMFKFFYIFIYSYNIIFKFLYSLILYSHWGFTLAGTALGDPIEIGALRGVPRLVLSLVLSCT